MQPTRVDQWIIQSLRFVQAKPFWVEAIETLSYSPFSNGLVYATPLFLLLESSQGSRRGLVDRTILTILAATVIGTLGSLLLRRWVRWPAPASDPGLASVYAPQFREYFRVHPNPNSFPSDSAMLYFTVVLGTYVLSHWLSTALLVWLMIFVAPAKIFVGGHYATDVLVGLLLGLLAYSLSAWLMTACLRPGTAFTHSGLLSLLEFCWLFEVGNELRDVRHIAGGFHRVRALF